jgi:glycosyltransferase involved in cell wall biosynthesis
VRVIFVNRYYAPDHSATSQMLTDLATALASEFQIHVVTSRQRYDDPAASLPRYELNHLVSIDRVYATTFGRASLLGRALDYLSFYATAALRLLHLARPGDVIVAKTDPPLISVPAGWVARLRGARLMNWLQDVFPEVAGQLGLSIGSGFVGRTLRRLRNASLRKAAINVVLGTQMADRVAAAGVPRERIQVIHNWADGTALQPMAPETNPLRTEWRLAERFVVGYSGNFGRVHEFHTMVGAAQELKAQPEIVFLLIGAGAQITMLEIAARDQGLTNLAFKPYQPRSMLSQSLGAADVHVVTLRPELEGLVVPSKFYGIAAVGRPTIFIGDKNGEIATIIGETESGLCVAQGDVKGLADAIVTLRGDPRLRERMGRNARRAFELRFDKSIAVAAWRSLLHAAKQKSA